MSPPAQNARSPAPRNDDPVDGAVPLPFVEGGRNQPDHGEGQRVQRLGAIEHNDAGAAAALNRAPPRLPTAPSRRGDFREHRVDRLGDILNRGHAVDFTQETALAIEGRHRGGVALICRETRFEHFRIIVLAHGLSGGACFLSAADNSIDELRRFNGEFDRSIESQPLGGEHRLERPRLRHVRGKPSRINPSLRVRLLDPVVDDVDDDVVRHQRARIPSPPWP